MGGPAPGEASMGGNEAGNDGKQAGDEEPAQLPTKEEMDKELQEYMASDGPTQASASASTLPKEEEQDKEQGTSDSQNLD